MDSNVGAVALVALGSWLLAKLGYSLIAAPKAARHTFYVHEIRVPPVPTLIAAAGPGANDLTQIGFGSFLVFDNEIREGPGRDSLLLGRERGFGPISDLQGKEGIQVTSTMFFNADSGHNGTVTFHGNLGGTDPRSELLVVGGTGDFRGVRGYALVETIRANPLDFVFRWTLYLSS